MGRGRLGPSTSSVKATGGIFSRAPPRWRKALRHDQRHRGIRAIIMLSPLVEGNLLFDGKPPSALGPAALHLPSLGREPSLERKGTFQQGGGWPTRAVSRSTDYLTTARRPRRPRGDARAQPSMRAGGPDHRAAPRDVVNARRRAGFIRPDDYIKHLRSTEGKDRPAAMTRTLAVPDPFPEQETAWSSDPLLERNSPAPMAGLYGQLLRRDELGFKNRR